MLYACVSVYAVPKIDSLEIAVEITSNKITNWRHIDGYLNDISELKYI